jgi:hypothetical protein
LVKDNKLKDWWGGNSNTLDLVNKDSRLVVGCS